MEDSGRLLITKDYTTTPDVYFDSLMRTLSDGEWKVLSVIIRKTIGFGKFSDKIAMSQILDMTGYTQRKSVLRVRASLVAKGLISFTQSQGGSAENCTEYTIVLPEGVSYKHGVDETRVSETPDTGVLNALTRVSETTPTIDSFYNRQSTTHTERASESPDMRRLDEPLKLYAEHCFRFDRIVNDPALIAACHRIGVQAVGDALRQCAQEAQVPGHLKRHTPTLSKLLHDTDNMLKRASMYKPQKPRETAISPDQQTLEWLESMTDDQREHEFSEAERLGQTWPEEVLKRWKLSQRQTSRAQSVA